MKKVSMETQEVVKQVMKDIAKNPEKYGAGVVSLDEVEAEIEAMNELDNENN